ncbi:MAG TPA: SDR family oxidoreductase [Gemmatimonadaceae bacterium]|nr:SDR family oxidoreductase [Gemmatimonadaceae bacterium]
MDLGLRGKVALVCGASKGIGYAAAEELAREGASVAICARDGAGIDAAAARLAPLGANVVAFAADLSTEGGLKTAVSRVSEAFGRVDVLVTNTGGPPTAAPLAPDWAAWMGVAELLLRSAVELTRAFVPGMRERKWGRVIGITSLAVKQPVPGLVLSNSMRAAVTGYFRTLADDVAADGVTVNTVLPGFTDTERLRSLADTAAKQQGGTRDAVYEKYRAATPARRVGAPEEVAAMITFLASTRAAFVTGQAILVDGGAVRTLL